MILGGRAGSTGSARIGAVADLKEKLSKIVGGDHVVVGDALEPYSHDKTFVTASPDFAVLPGSTEEVAQVVELLYEADIPIVGRGAGSGLSGGAVAIGGGVVVSLERLRELSVDKAKMTATAQAGVMTADLREAAAEQGLLYPPDPASIEISTIGGNIATNAGGPSGLKYGVTADYVLAVTAVLAGGRTVRFGGSTRKRSSGYRIAQLLVGSEGTLGLITEATLALVPAPTHIVSLIADFEDVVAATNGVQAILSSGITPSACELIDSTSLGFVADLLPEGISKDAAAILLVESDGSTQEAVSWEGGKIATVLLEAGASTVRTSESDEERERLWEARRSIGLRLMDKRSFRLSEDLAVPLDRIPEMVRAVHDVARSSGLTVALFGHAGDGNLHPSLVFDDRQPSTLATVSGAAAQIFRAAIELGGTVSAEHGLGAIKKEFLGEDAGVDATEIMWSIKELFDPKGLFNPGKVLPTGAVPTPGFLDAVPGWQQ